MAVGKIQLDPIGSLRSSVHPNNELNLESHNGSYLIA